VTSHLPLSTGPSAAAAYRQGVDHLVDGRIAEAAAAFRRAVTEDRCFALGHAALAVALAELDHAGDRPGAAGRSGTRPGFDAEVVRAARCDPDGGAATRQALDAADRARSCSRRLSRGERHHVEVVVLTLRDRPARASALGREHLYEFPGDRVVGHVLRRWCDDDATSLDDTG
jgi:hypothetical protein